MSQPGPLCVGIDVSKATLDIGHQQRHYTVYSQQ